jgi:hypothetical protein
MIILDDGHLYDLTQLGGGTQQLRFVKRSGGAVRYKEEWPGVQSQEVLRALINRNKFLNQILPCKETEDALYHLRMVIFLYEVRAWRRKQSELNRKDPAHDDSARPRSWRENPFDDVPFNEHEIEFRLVGEDGHILI